MPAGEAAGDQPLRGLEGRYVLRTGQRRWYAALAVAWTVIATIRILQGESRMFDILMAALWAGTAAMVWFENRVTISAQGVRFGMTRTIPWSRIQRVDDPNGWRPDIRLVTTDGRTRTLTGLPQETQLAVTHRVRSGQSRR